ncbi:MAG: superinfection immunity protein [candidate division SR1 bacterium]|nr:superinfection immunity protein [candidate division SR1 bacterium]
MGSDFGTLMSGVIVGIIVGCIYAIPSYISKGKIRFWQVFWINILLGWTLVGWVVALVIALDKSNTKADEQIVKADMDKLKIGLIWAIGIILLFWIVGYFS